MCFPIWPDCLRLALWYASAMLLIVLFMTLLLRLLLFLFVSIFGWEFWVLINLVDDFLAVVDSFKPLCSFERTKPGQLWWRNVMLGGFGAFFYWTVTQPTEFDEFINANTQFVDDLHEGNPLNSTWMTSTSAVCRSSWLTSARNRTKAVQL